MAAVSAWADTVQGGQFNNLNAVSISTSGSSNPATGTPFWNQGSDGTGNVAAFLTAQGNFATQTTYVSSSTGQYYSASGNSANPAAFSFLQGASTVNVAVLFANAGQNFGNTFGTTVGIYDLSNSSNRVVLFGPGSLYNGANNDCVGTATCVSGTNTINGLFNAGNGSGGAAGTAPPTANGAATFAQWGIYATTCTNSSAGTGCNTFFSGTPGSDTVNPSGGGSAVAHQHFALFAAASNSTTFMIGFEDFFGNNANEGNFGDYNDVILQFTTSAAPGGVPEPGTLSVMGLGLVGLGVIRKFRKN